MKKFMMSAAVLALLTAPALAQSSVTTTQTTRTIDTPVPMPPPPPVMPAPVYGSSTSTTVTHSDNGLDRTDSSSQTSVAPDGSTTTTRKVIEQETH